MKRIFIFSLALLAAGKSFSQELVEISKMADKKQFAAAKEGIDKYLADPKHAAETNAWYNKGNIYTNYSADPALPAATAYELKVQAFDAYRKTQENTKPLDYLALTQYQPFLILYSGFYNLGANQFNAKDYAGAYLSFKKALDVEDFIKEKKYTYNEINFSGLDTALVLNTGAAARNAKDLANATVYYKKLADANVTGQDFEDTYAYLAGYYYEQKDQANLDAIVAKGKKFYPSNPYWNDIEMDKLTKGGDQSALFAKYEEIYQQNPGNFANDYNYSVELYNSLYTKDGKNADPDAAKAKLTQVLKSAIAADTSIDATVLIMNHLFNWGADYSTAASEVKGAKPEDVKKKKDLNALSLAKLDEVIPYAEKVIAHYQATPPKKTSEKINLKNAANHLSEIYGLKNNPKKAAEYDAIVDGINFQSKP
jgi:hypothetical protein